MEALPEAVKLSWVLDEADRDASADVLHRAERLPEPLPLASPVEVVESIGESDIDRLDRDVGADDLDMAFEVTAETLGLPVTAADVLALADVLATFE